MNKCFFFFFFFFTECGKSYSANTGGIISSDDMQGAASCRWLLIAKQSGEDFFLTLANNHMFVCVCVYMYVRVYDYMKVCVCVCDKIYICVYMYVIIYVCIRGGDGTSATRARHDQQLGQCYSKWIKNHPLISSKHT